ncbi:hypothetical protein MtrunA17_Chr6g0465591 [Medicago truncatula]|uniref:Transmembrane protein n=1 Tax=Medicago truncatula TaxID=3880 RepID=A0A396HF64_MEDTR|nr:hypothetical protein MtrunA17_Chr6g0465591 [Medicago truncatula]
MIPPRANVYPMIIFLFIFFVTMFVKGKTISILLNFFGYFILNILSYFSNIFFFSFFIIVSHSHCVIDAHCPRNSADFIFHQGV